MDPIPRTALGHGGAEDLGFATGPGPAKNPAESDDPFLSQAHAEIHTPTQRTRRRNEARRRFLVAGMQLLPLPNCQRTLGVPAVSAQRTAKKRECNHREVVSSSQRDFHNFFPNPSFAFPRRFRGEMRFRKGDAADEAEVRAPVSLI